MMKFTFLYFLMTSGMMSTSKSTPFLKFILHITTMFILPSLDFLVGSGVNLVVSTAFGTTYILEGSILALSAKFSLLV